MLKLELFYNLQPGNEYRVGNKAENAISLKYRKSFDCTHTKRKIIQKQITFDDGLSTRGCFHDLRDLYLFQYTIHNQQQHIDFSSNCVIYRNI